MFAILDLKESIFHFQYSFPFLATLGHCELSYEVTLPLHVLVFFVGAFVEGEQGVIVYVSVFVFVHVYVNVNIHVYV